MDSYHKQPLGITCACYRCMPIANISDVSVDEGTIFLKTVIAGSITGSLVVAMMQPLDVLKVRFQLQTEPLQKGSKYSSIFQAIRTIAREEGVSALWSGHVSAQQLSMLYGCLQFSMYDLMTKYEKRFFKEQLFGSNFVKGSIAAGVGVTASYPFDTVRTRLIAEMKTKRAYKGVIDAFAKIVKHEGPLALYKGLTPTLMQIPPYAGVQFTVYEWFINNVFRRFKIMQKRESDSETTLFGKLLSGSMAGFTSKSITYPFDLIKKRLQIQGFQKHRKAFGKQIYCDGVLDCVRLTIKKEGVLALYKGFKLSIIKAVAMSALHFGYTVTRQHQLLLSMQSTYITKISDGDVDETTIFLKSAIAGSMTGSLVVAMTQPLEVLKVRFQLQTEPLQKGSKYSSILQAFRTTIREEGVKALWGGHVPAQYLAILHGFLQFSTYDLMTNYEKRHYTEQFFGSNFVKGSIASGVAMIASYPFDTVRTRLIAEIKTERAYKGVNDAFANIVKHEGPSALYKGLTPTLMQIPPHAGVQFAVYEWFSRNVFTGLNITQTQDSNSETSLLVKVLSGSAAGFTSKSLTYPFDLIKKRLQIQGFQKHRKAFGKQIQCDGVLDCIRLTIKSEGVLALYKGYKLSIIKAMAMSALHFGVYYEIKYFIISRP